MILVRKQTGFCFAEIRKQTGSCFAEIGKQTGSFFVEIGFEIKNSKLVRKYENYEEITSNNEIQCYKTDLRNRAFETIINIVE